MRLWMVILPQSKADPEKEAAAASFAKPIKNPQVVTLLGFLLAVPAAPGGNVSGHGQHPFQCDFGQSRFVLGNFNLVDHNTFNQIFQRPGQMLRVNPLHG